MLQAALIGSETCVCEDLTAKGSAPVLAMCRKLVAAGYDPATPLEVYRGETLALRVRSIGEAAQLEVSDGRLVKRRQTKPERHRGGPPMRKNGGPYVRQPPTK